MSRIISFRGLLADGAQERIPLQTNKGLVGYRIVKFQIIPQNAGSADVEGIMKIYKVQTAVAAGFDFSDNTLLGGAFLSMRDGAYFNEVIVFDNEIFNQDIYITFKDISTGQSMNYYIELEQIKLDTLQAQVASLKDLRNNA